jgi:hypothetical protein
VIVGIWGGLLEGGLIGIDRSLGTNRIAGELIYP